VSLDKCIEKFMAIYSHRVYWITLPFSITDMYCHIPFVLNRLLFRSVYNGTTTMVNKRLKPGFHYPSSRPEFTGRVDGPWTRVHFLTPVNSGRQLRCQKCTRVHGPAVNSARELGPWTRVVETGLYCYCYAVLTIFLSVMMNRPKGCIKYKIARSCRWLLRNV